MLRLKPETNVRRMLGEQAIQTQGKQKRALYAMESWD
jgi:hypothetical protein